MHVRYLFYLVKTRLRVRSLSTLTMSKCTRKAGKHNVAAIFWKHNVSNREGGIGSEDLVTEDLGEEDIIGLALGFEAVATDGAVG